MVGGFPDLEPEVVGGEDGPADMVGSDVENLATLDHADHAALHPNVLVDKGRAAGRVFIEVLGDAVAVHVVDRVDHLSGLGQFPQVRAANQRTALSREFPLCENRARMRAAVPLICSPQLSSTTPRLHRS